MDDTDEDTPTFRVRVPALRVVLTAVATVVLLGLLVRYTTDERGLVRAARGMRLIYLPLAIALALLNLVLSAIRWRIILKAMGHHLGLARGLGIVLATWPLAVVTPSRASDLLRAVLIRPSVPLSTGTASVFVEKLVDVNILCVLTLVGALACHLWALGTLVTGLLLVGWAVFAIGLLNRRWPGPAGHLPRVTRCLREFLAAVSQFPQDGRALWTVVGASLWAWGNSIGIIICWLLITNVDFDPAEIVMIWPIATLVGALPVTIAGMGTRDAAFLYLLDLVRHGAAPHEPVLLATIGYALTTTWLFAILGIPFTIVLFSLPCGRMRPDQSEETGVDLEADRTNL